MTKNTFMMYSTEQAQIFANKWLPAWTGNRPDRLISFYSDDAFYSDPALPNGIQGYHQIFAYFQKLLAKFPNWVWVQQNAIPLENGFLNQWQAVIPIGQRIIQCQGVCTVQLRNDLIYRNQVYFDRSELLAALTSS